MRDSLLVGRAQVHWMWAGGDAERVVHLLEERGRDAQANSK